MSASVKYSSSLKLLRNISHELRKFLKNDGIKSNASMAYILDMYRRHDVTDQRVCRSQHELQYLAETYLCYINSSLNYQTIYDKYYSKGERTVGQTAQMVGFKLPKDYKQNNLTDN